MFFVYFLFVDNLLLDVFMFFFFVGLLLFFRDSSYFFIDKFFILGISILGRLFGFGFVSGIFSVGELDIDLEEEVIFINGDKLVEGI